MIERTNEKKCDEKKGNEKKLKIKKNKSAKKKLRKKEIVWDKDNSFLQNVNSINVCKEGVGRWKYWNFCFKK